MRLSAVLRRCSAMARLQAPLSVSGMKRTGAMFAIAFELIAGSIRPASARSDQDQLGQPPPSLVSPARGSAQARAGGQCEIAYLDLRQYRPGDAGTHGLDSLGYMGRPDSARGPDLAEARRQVERVLRVSGLEMNFQLVVDPATPASAEIVNGRRVILFDPHFMAQVADPICPDWGAMSILAHEVGHHLAGHTLRQPAEPWRDELEADEFSGFVLARLGATLAQTTSAAARMLPEQATPSHPARKDRIGAIVHGWQNAEAMVSAEKTQAPHHPGLVPMRQARFDPDSSSAEGSDVAPASRIILYDDPNDYYITKGGRIDAYDGTRRAVGRKAVPSKAEFAWTFQADLARFDVDYNGRVFMRLPSGGVHEVGLVVALLPDAANNQ